MFENYIELSKAQVDRIEDFSNSLLVCGFTSEESINHHKEWLNHIIEKAKELNDMEDDIFNERKKR
jgi:hypothetical protein